MTPTLTAERTARWRRRVPHVALALAVAIPLAALVAAELTLDTAPCTPTTPCRLPLSSLAYHAAPVAELLAMGTVALALLLPRAAVWLAAVAAGVLAGPAAADSSVPGLWRWALAWFVAVGVVDLLGRWRQVVESHTWEAPTVPYPDADPGVTDRLPRDEDTRLLAVLVAGVGLLAFGGMLAWHLQATASVMEFEAHARRSQATVTKVSDDGLTVTLSVDGRMVDVEPSDDYSPGESVPVLVDAADPGHVALVAEPEDPSWRIGVAGLLLAGALAVAGRLWSRGLRRARLVREGGPAVRLRVGVRQGEILLTTLDDERFDRPLALVGGDLIPSGVLLPISTLRERAGSLAEDEDDLALHEPREVTTLTDAELAEWADEEVDAFDDDEDAWSFSAAVPPAIEGGTPATVVGLRQDGDPVLLLLDDGESLVSSSGLRDPWGWRRLRDRTLRRGAPDPRPPASPRHGAPSRAADVDDAARREADALSWRSGRKHQLAVRASALASPIARPLAYVLAAAIYPAARWLLDGQAGWGDLARFAFVGVAVVQGLVFLAAMDQPAVTARPDGLLHSGRWTDELIPTRRVVGVTSGRSSVVLKLADPDDALALPPQSVVRFADFLREETDPDRARQVIEEMLRSTTPSASRGWRRPSPSLGPGVLGGLALLAAWATVHFGVV